MNQPRDPPAGHSALYPALFLASFSTLGFEVLLLRVFSISLWYHFAFMVVSIAMLGLAVAGTALALGRSLLRLRPRSVGPSLFLILGLTMTGSFLVAVRIPFDPVRLSWDMSQILLISLYYVVLALPFLVNGIIVATAYSSRGEKSGAIYASDLTGAAAGSAVVVVLQFHLSPGVAILVFSSAAAMGAFITGAFRHRVAAAALVVLYGIALFISPGLARIPLSPYKELPFLLRMQGAETLATLESPYGRIDLFRSPGLRHAPGLSLRYRGDVPGQTGISVDGSAVTTVHLEVPAEEDGEFLEWLPSALAFELRGDGDVLLVDPRGGISPHMADRSGSGTATCVESNPAVLRLLVEKGMDLSPLCSGGTFTGTARSFLAPRPGRYDLIHLSLSGTIPSGGPLGGGEDYGLTVEAFTTYFKALREDGILNVTAFLAPPSRGEPRLFATIVAALERTGSTAPGDHIAVMQSLGTICFLAKKTPFTPGEISRFSGFTESRWFEPLFPAAAVPSDEGADVRTADGDLPSLFEGLADPSRRGNVVERYLFDISPPTDDRPYFHDHLRIETLRDVYRYVEGKWDFFIFEGYLIPFLLLQAALLGSVLVILPASLSCRGVPGKGKALIYFAFLGGGYMLVEVALIQAAILVLGKPVIAMAVVVSSLLVSSGAGSYISRNWRGNAIPAAALAAGSLALVAAAGRGSIPPLLQSLSPSLSTALLALLVVPLGLVLGTLFPAGMRCLSMSEDRLIPWTWAVNGFFSVLAPAAAVMVSARWGIGTVLVLGSLCYFGSAAAGLGFCASPTIGTNRTPDI